MTHEAKSNYRGSAVTIVVALISSFMVFYGPIQTESQASGFSATYNDLVCDLGDPNDHSSSDTAFEVSDEDELWEITDCVSASSTVFFKLMNDIVIPSGAPVGADTEKPIGYSTSEFISFSGVLDGQNFVVSGLSMSSSVHGVGLFAYLHNATISNLVISGVASTDVTSSGDDNSAGALAIRAAGNVYLNSISNQATITGFQDVGGLIGYVQNDITIIGSQNIASISGGDTNVGGLVGYVGEDVSIDSSRNAGTVSGQSNNVGGLVGRAVGNLGINASQNIGFISGVERVGGLLGDGVAMTQITSSQNVGTVSGSVLIGGFLGYNASANITSSYNTGNVSGTGDKVGGFVGASGNEAKIHFSINAADVTGGGEFVGGLVGDGIVTNIFSTSNEGTITGGAYTGGLLGYVDDNANVTSSSNNGTVSAIGEYVGGLAGYSFNASIQSSRNAGTISGSSNSGGLLGYVANNANITSSFNIGPVFGSTNSGGLLGSVDNNTNITSSFNTGPVSGLDKVGGLVGDGGTATIYSSYNSGEVSGSDSVGGLVGNAGETSIISSFNAGSIFGLDEIAGGLVGVAEVNTFRRSYNTGNVAGQSYVGGLLGFTAYATVEFSYNAATVTGTSDVDGLVAFVAPGIVSTTSAYSSVASLRVSTTTVADMKLASTYTDFDFGSTWGFGSPTDNQGFPMLRVFAEIGTYYSDFAQVSSNSRLASLVLSQGSLAPIFAAGTISYSASVPNAISSLVITPTTADSGASLEVEGVAVSSGNASGAVLLAVGSNALSVVVTAADLSTTTYTITVTRAAAESPQKETPDPAPVYVGPVISEVQSTEAGTEVAFYGNRLNGVTTAEVAGIQLAIVSATAESLILEIPSSMPPGTYDLKLQSSFGTLSFQNGLTITAAFSDGSETTTDVEATGQTLSVGSFMGFVVIYTKGYEGQRLSAKIAGKWLVVPELQETWKGTNLSRTLRKVGSGNVIKVHLYIDRELVRTEELITR